LKLIQHSLDYTVNGQTSVSVSPSTALTYAGAGFSTGATLQGRNNTNTANLSNTTTAPVTAGTYTYYASATKTLNTIARNSTARSVSVTVVDFPTIGTVNSPTNVFANGAFDMTWSGSNVVNYKIRGNVATSGVSTSDVDLGTTASRSITPTAAGTYTYTITATNAASVTTTSTKIVTVEADPTFTAHTVNGQTTISVAPNAALTYAGSGFSSGAVLVGRNSGNTSDISLPTNASTSVGTTTYYAAAAKSLNSVVRYSSLSSVSVTVVANPTISAITAPSPVFSNAALTMSWSGTGVTSYRIRGSSSSSGVSTSDVDLGSATSTSISPTAAGTYTYTITAINSVGATVTNTSTVTVESDPTFSNVTVNGLTMPTSFTIEAWSTLTFRSSGLSNGANNLIVITGMGLNDLQGMDTWANAYQGVYYYNFSVFKTLNGVTRYSNTKIATVTVPTTVII
jgi:hypothetical protein